MKLLSYNPVRIGRPTLLGAGSGVPLRLAGGAPEPLRSDMVGLLGEQQVHARVSDLVRYASDASPYRLIPQVVVSPRTPEQLADVLRYCGEHGRHATFRAAGTSLSGQSQSDDVLIDVRRHFAGFEVLDEGRLVRVRPGAIVGDVNAVLGRLGRQLGPDPASGRASTMGALIVNNAAGMRCTLEKNAYATVRDMVFVLPSGTIIDTSAPDAEQAFVEAEPRLSAGLQQIREDILARPDLVERIRSKYAIRNTTGYTMRAFLDAKTPLRIFQKLIVGSEGTLCFVAQATLVTFPVPKHVGLWWIHADGPASAVSLVGKIKAMGPTAVEMIPGSVMSDAVGVIDGAVSEWKSLPATSSSLLVEFGAETREGLEEIHRQLVGLTADTELLLPLVLDDSPEFSVMSWRVRSNLNGNLAMNRPEGAANINEDVCFPPARLADAVADLTAMLDAYGYPNIVAGHAAYGNMHFTLTPKLGKQSERVNYGKFMDEFAALVIDKYDGSLKAEHGTGLNMAPFVRREWGDEIYDLMWRIKDLVDPQRILAPDVILTRKDDIHLSNFRTEPKTDPLIDKCIECGFCEPVCPSRNVTTTPRQRIALRREMARQQPGSPVLKALIAEYQYDAVDTCAVDSSCAGACPYSIDTGALVKRFRARQSSRTMEMIWLWVAMGWGLIERIARALIAVVYLIQSAVGWRLMKRVADGLRTLVNNDIMPTVPGPMPRPAKKLPRTVALDAASAVYFPACVNRIFGRDPDATDDLSLPEALVALSARAGRSLAIAEDVAGNCCGTIWSSKGHERGRDYMFSRVAESILKWSKDGQLPVVVDAASCTYGLISQVPEHISGDLLARYSKVRIIDSIQWCHELVANLDIDKVAETIVVHPGCSVTKMGLSNQLLQLADKVADNVVVPVGTGCCGTAGDRGLLHPELVLSATRDERANMPVVADAWLSDNRTCEMGLRQATGKPYESFVFMLEKATRRSTDNI